MQNSGRTFGRRDNIPINKHPRRKHRDARIARMPLYHRHVMLCDFSFPLSLPPLLFVSLFLSHSLPSSLTRVTFTVSRTFFFTTTWFAWNLCALVDRLSTSKSLRDSPRCIVKRQGYTYCYGGDRARPWDIVISVYTRDHNDISSLKFPSAALAASSTRNAEIIGRKSCMD